MGTFKIMADVKKRPKDNLAFDKDEDKSDEDKVNDDQDDLDDLDGDEIWIQVANTKTEYDDEEARSHEDKDDFKGEFDDDEDEERLTGNKVDPDKETRF